MNFMKMIMIIGNIKFWETQIFPLFKQTQISVMNFMGCSHARWITCIVKDLEMFLGASTSLPALSMTWQDSTMEMVTFVHGGFQSTNDLNGYAGDVDKEFD